VERGSPGLLIFRRSAVFACAVNCGPEPAGLPSELHGFHVLLSSGSSDDPTSIPADTTVWLVHPDGYPAGSEARAAATAVR
jgi:hypothetical protein